MHLAIRIYLPILFLLAWTGHTYFFHLTEHVSLSGYSIIEYLAQLAHPENFTHDFPNGNAIGASHAIISRFYAPLHNMTGLSGVSLLTGMIGLEVAAVIASAWVLWSALATAETNELRRARLWCFCWLATMLVSGFVMRPNISNFGYPFFHGQFYGFADATSMIAVAMMLRKRWMGVCLILCLGFAIHPTKTLMTAAFIAAASLANGYRSISKPQVFWGAVTGLFAAAWGYWWLGLGETSVAKAFIPDADYIAYTRAWQYHWYPIDRGFIGQYQANYLTPFLGVLLMGALALRKASLPLSTNRALIGGYAMLAILTLVGLWFSYALVSVFMVKMAFIRASEFMTLLSAFIVMAAFYHQWRHGSLFWAALFIGYLFSGMLQVKYLGLGLPVAALVLYVVQHNRSRTLFAGENKISSIALLSLGLSFVAVTVAIWLTHADARLPLLPSVAALVSVLIFGVGLARSKASATRHPTRQWEWLPLVASAAFLAASGAYFVAGFWLGADRMEKARAYHEVQLWAKENTPVSALFMVDPCYAYGWREFSQRSSIGTPFEWYHTGWLYVSDAAVFNRGQAIGKTLGLDFTQRLATPDQPAKQINYDVCAEAQELFYAPDFKALQRMSREHQVAYFVLEKQRFDKNTPDKKRHAVFSNSYYYVFSAKDIGA